MADNVERMEFDLTARDRGVERTFDRVAGSADRAGTSFDGLGKDSKNLDTKISETEEHLKKLIVEFEKTDDVTLFRGIRKDRSTLSLLKAMRKEVSDVADDADTAGKKIGKSATGGFIEALGSLPSRLKGSGIAGLVGLAALAAPSIGAAIGAAVVGGVGIGGIIGGVAAAVQDERVHDAGVELGENFVSGWKSAGRIFIAPVLDAMTILEHAENTVLADMSSGFAKLAPLVVPLAHGLEGMARALSPGWEKGFTAAQPVVRFLANELPGIGAAFSDMFSDISDESDGAVMGLAAVLHLTEYVVRGIGGTIADLSAIFDWMVRNTFAVTSAVRMMLEPYEKLPVIGRLVGAFLDPIQDLNGKTGALLTDLDKAKDSGDDWAGSLADQAEGARAAAAQVEQYQKALEDLFGIQMGLDEANIRYQEAIDKTLETLKDGKRTLDINTEAGRDNKQAILDQLQAIEDLRKARIDSGMQIADANKLAVDEQETLRITAERLGFNRRQVEQLIGAYEKIPKRAATEVEAPGLSPTLAHAIELDHYFDEIDGRNVRSTITTEFVSYRAGERDPSGGHRAMGGPTMAGRTYLVGEHGPEIRTESASGYIHSAAETRRLLSGASGGSAARGPLQLELVARFEGSGVERDLGEALMRFMRYQVRNVGGGSVEDTYGFDES